MRYYIVLDATTSQEAEDIQFTNLVTEFLSCLAIELNLLFKLFI